MTSAGAATERPPACAAGELIAHHLDHEALGAPAIELAVEDRLPWTEVETPLRDGKDHLVVDQEVLEMRIAVVLAASVVAVVAGVRKQRASDLVGRLLPAGRRHLVEPLEGVLLKPWLVVVDPDRGGDVHRGYQDHSLRDSGGVNRALHVLGDPDELAPLVG